MKFAVLPTELAVEFHFCDLFFRWRHQIPPGELSLVSYRPSYRPFHLVPVVLYARARLSRCNIGRCKSPGRMREGLIKSMKESRCATTYDTCRTNLFHSRIKKFLTHALFLILISIWISCAFIQSFSNTLITFNDTFLLSREEIKRAFKQRLVCFVVFKAIICTEQCVKRKSKRYCTAWRNKLSLFTISMNDGVTYPHSNCQVNGTRNRIGLGYS